MIYCHLISIYREFKVLESSIITRRGMEDWN